jgi:hypothetical protein
MRLTGSWIATGGRISQKIIGDTIPTLGRRTRSVQRDSMCQTQCSVLYIDNRQTDAHLLVYLDTGLPWYTLYNEKLPHVNGTDGSTHLSGVQSIAALDAQKL